MDRHLFGLKVMALEKGIKLPLIFSSNIYKELMHFRLSTSQVPTNEEILMGFGPSANDCYGICYNPKENNISFTITSFNDSIETNATKLVLFKNSYNKTFFFLNRFAAELENSLLMLNYILKEEKTNFIKSNL